MVGNRVFIGRLPHGCREQDIENFFRRCGRIRSIMLKRGYAFVDFRNDRDAADAVHDMNGRTMRGERMTVEIASGRPRKGTREQIHRSSNFGNDSLSRNEYQIVVDNLSSRVSWKDFKDMIRREDIEVVYVDAHKLHKHQGVVKFKTYGDLKRAVKRFQHREIEGRRIEITVTRQRSRERSSESLDRRPAKRRYRSRSGSSRSPSPRPKRTTTTTPPFNSKEAGGQNTDTPPRRCRPTTPVGKCSQETSGSRSRSPPFSNDRSSRSSSSESASSPKTPGSP